MNVIAETWRCRERSPRTEKLYDELEADFRSSIGILHKQEDFIEFLLENLPQIPLLLENEETKAQPKAPRLDLRLSPSVPLLELSFNNLPYEAMVRYFAGPIHRRYGCFWRLQVSSNRLTLRTDLNPQDYGRSFRLDLDCWNGFPGCEIVEEKETTTYNYSNYRIKCNE